METKCPECGSPLSGTEKACPECGCPIQNENVLTDEKVLIDDYDYSQFYDSWLLSPWSFSHEEDSEEENFDQLNDSFLLGAIAFRMILRALLVAIIFIVAGTILTAILINERAEEIALFADIVIVIGGVIAVIYYFKKGLAKYWVPFHRTLRRIHKRYWINMHKGVENNTVDNI